MKLIYCLLLIICLVGCASNEVKHDIVTQNHYTTRIIPDEYFVIPSQVPNIDLATSTQKDVSKWIAESEQRSAELELKIKAIKKVQDENIAKDDK